MRLARSVLKISLRLLGAALLLITLVATLWTLGQVVQLAGVGPAVPATIEARQAAYRATATALGIERAPSSLRANSHIILLQQDTDANTAAPAPRPIRAREPGLAETPAPDNFDLPRLLVPLDPAGDKWLSGTRAPARARQAQRDHELVNFILLGSDEELTEDNFIRTDTMILVSLNLDTGTISMLNLPRDLFVYIVHGKMGRLNTAFGLGEYLGWEPDGGFGLLRQTIFYNFGINIHYYARVNFSAFEEIIDILGGVDIAVDCDYRDYYPVAEADEGRSEASNYRLRTLPVGYYTFDGFDALWYARIRRYTDDFDRGRRQQQLLRSIWRALRSQGLAAAVPRMWGEISEIVDTDIPLDLMLRLLPQVINMDLGSVENLTFRKTYHTRKWTTPAGSEVLLPNIDAVAELMQDFYTPPSPYQAALIGPSIAVLNASGQDSWDIVASERLRWGGYNAVALGRTQDDRALASNLLIDYVATEKGSLVPGLLAALNMNEDQVQREPTADRRYDYQVLIGRDYKSCTFGVLSFEE